MLCTLILEPIKQTLILCNCKIRSSIQKNLIRENGNKNLVNILSLKFAVSSGVDSTHSKFVKSLKVTEGTFPQKNSISDLILSMSGEPSQHCVFVSFYPVILSCVTVRLLYGNVFTEFVFILLTLFKCSISVIS